MSYEEKKKAVVSKLRKSRTDATKKSYSSSTKSKPANSKNKLGYTPAAKKYRISQGH